MYNLELSAREMELLTKALKHTSKKLREVTVEYADLIIEENHQELKVFYEYEDLLKKIENL